MKTKISITLDENVIEEIKTMVDGVHIRNTSQAVEYMLKKTLSGNNKAIFLCGGNMKKTESGYFRPCTPFLGVPVIVHNIRFLRDNGFREIIILAQKPALIEIEKTINSAKISGVEIKYLEDPLNSQGTMDTLREVIKLEGTTLIAFGDVIFFNNDIQNFWKTHLLYKATATLYAQAFIEKIQWAGVISMEGNQINSFVQKPGKVFSLIHFGGAFIVEPNIMEYKGNSLEYDIFPVLAAKNQLIGYMSEKPIHHFHTEKEIKELETKLKKPS
ncbi:MAG: NDP-sugar synthase [archaeon]|jgi:NDP-sugar pyrophosphorylase family protein